MAQAARNGSRRLEWKWPGIARSLYGLVPLPLELRLPLQSPNQFRCSNHFGRQTISQNNNKRRQSTKQHNNNNNNKCKSWLQIKLLKEVSRLPASVELMFIIMTVKQPFYLPTNFHNLAPFSARRKFNYNSFHSDPIGTLSMSFIASKFVLISVRIGQNRFR